MERTTASHEPDGRVPLPTPAGEATSGLPLPEHEVVIPHVLTRAVDATRYVVLLAVLSVVMVAMLVFLGGTLLTLGSIRTAAGIIIAGEVEGHDALVTVLGLVVVMLEAVVFYIVGIGLYSIFIQPLRLARRLGLDTLDHVESKIVSVIIVMLAVNFVENLIRTHNSMDSLLHAAAIALVVPPLVWFKRQLH